MKRTASLFVTGIVICCCIIGLSACDRKLNHEEITQLTKAVLQINVYDEEKNMISSGSGFCLYDSQTLVTNYHVIENGHSVVAVSEDNIQYNVSGVCYYDKNRDIAILRFDNKTTLPVLSLSFKYEVGEEIYAIGSPLGLKNTISNGIISGVRDNEGYKDIQITAPISPGSSGGALLNAMGKVIGITYACIENGQNLNFAIPVADFQNIEYDINRFESFSDVVSYNHPYGNHVQNFGQFSEGLFVAEYVCDGESYIILNHNHDYSQDRLSIISSDGRVINSIDGYLYPNVYHSKLYCYKVYDSIVEIDLRRLIAGEENEKTVCSLENLKIDTIDSMLVSDWGFLIRSDDTIMRTDLEGQVVHRLTEAGIGSGVLTEQYDFAYSTDESTNIEVINLETFEKQRLEVGVIFASVKGYNDGVYFLETQNNDGNWLAITAYNVETCNVSKLFEEVQSLCFATYENRVFCGLPNGIVEDSKWFRSKCYDLYNIDLNDSEQYKIPVYSFEQINFGENGKMYIIGQQYKSSPKAIYQVNLDGSELEKIIDWDT